MYGHIDSWRAIGSWYVVHCKPCKESNAATILKEDLGLTVYLPETDRRLRGKVQPAPYFPGYLFVRANLQQVNLSSINSTPGVLRLLEFGGKPQAVPEPVVEAIREWVNMANSAGGLPDHGFRPGDKVWLKSGPLRGLQAEFVGPMTPSARVKVLLHFLGRLNEVQVDVDALSPAHSKPLLLASEEHKQKRRTRGKGRRISYQVTG